MIKPIKIKDRFIGPGYRPFIIAEACVNHNGDIDIAERMIYMAHALGADCIKFQMHCRENEMLKEVPQSDNFDTPLWDILDQTEFTVEEHIRLKALCEELGIFYLCTAFSRDAVEILDEEVGVEFFKTGSGELTNLPLMEVFANKGKPMIVSTGMCHEDEIKETVDLIQSIGTPMALTHCVSAYPCPYHRVNLGLIPIYAKKFGVPVGLSDHSSGIYTCLGSVALGACILEKHFTFDKLQKGPDHASSIEPYELGEMVIGAKAVFQAGGTTRKIFPEEEEIVAWARESVVSETAIKAGTVITKDMVWVKRPSPGPGVVPAKELSNVIGEKTVVDIPKDVQIKWEFLE